MLSGEGRRVLIAKWLQLNTRICLSSKFLKIKSFEIIRTIILNPVLIHEF